MRVRVNITTIIASVRRTWNQTGGTFAGKSEKNIPRQKFVQLQSSTVDTHKSLQKKTIAR